MKGVFISFLSLMTCLLYSQEVITAVNEQLISIPVGFSSGEIQYNSTDEGFFSVGSPYIDDQGRLVFGAKYSNMRKLIYSNGKIDEIDAINNSISIIGTPFVSQEGVGISSGNQYQLIGDEYVTIDYHKHHSFFDWQENYPMPFGALLYSEKEKSGIAVVFDVKNPTADFTVIDQAHLKDWLTTQPGNFSIGDDGLLYRNGMLWSATNPPMLGDQGLRYLGRLASGHIVWGGGLGPLGSETVFKICDPDGREELTVEFPWKSDVEKDHYQFDYGLGPWGEFCCLLPPPFVLVRKQNAMQAELWAPPSTGCSLPNSFPTLSRAIFV